MTGGSNSTYGVQFSPDDTKVYTQNYRPSATLFQVNLADGAIHEYDIANGLFGGMLSLAVDGKIYIGSYNNSATRNTHVGVVDDPNALGAAAGFNARGVAMPAACNVRCGLPTAFNAFALPIGGAVTIALDPGLYGDESLTPAGATTAPDGETVNVTVIGAGFTGSCVGTVVDSEWSCPDDAISGLSPATTYTVTATISSPCTSASDVSMFTTGVCTSDSDCSGGTPICGAVAGAPACVPQPTFDCGEVAWMGADLPAQLLSIDPGTLVIDDIGGDAHGFNYNAMGFRSSDGYIYAVAHDRTTRVSTNLLRIGSDGSVLDLGTHPTFPPRIMNSGDTGEDGFLYAMQSAIRTLYKINLDTRETTTILLSEAAATADLAYVEDDGLLYGVSRGDLVTINPLSGEVIHIGATGGPDSAGVMFSTTGGALYAYDNTDGRFYLLDKRTGAATLLTTYPRTFATNGDGASCREENPFGCAEDADCTMAGAPICDVGTGTCVPCAEKIYTPDGATAPGLPPAQASFSLAETHDGDVSTGYAPNSVPIPLPTTVSYTYTTPIPVVTRFELFNDAGVSPDESITLFSLIVKGAGGATIYSAPSTTVPRGFNTATVELGALENVTGFDLVIERTHAGGLSTNKGQWREARLVGPVGCVGGAVCDLSTDMCTECLDNLDCEDGNDCTFHTCESGTCVDTDATEGTTCDDVALVCTEAAVCAECTDSEAWGDPGCDETAAVCDTSGASPTCTGCTVDADCLSRGNCWSETRMGDGTAQSVVFPGRTISQTVTGAGRFTSSTVNLGHFAPNPEPGGLPVSSGSALVATGGTPLTVMINFGAPITNPRMHLWLLDSTDLTFSVPVRRVSGSRLLQVRGGVVNCEDTDGAPCGPGTPFFAGAEGTIELTGTFTSVDMTVTPTRRNDGFAWNFCVDDPEPAGACEGGLCITCVDSAAAGATDRGCDMATPVCLESATSATCVECAADADCASGVCDAMTNMCVGCVDSAAPGMIDRGCDAATPACDIRADPDVCVECLADADCAGGVCDEDTNSCAPCLDSATGAGIDDGCLATAPLCDDGGTPAMCQPCLDDSATLDVGCDADAPVCDTSGASNVCLPCEDSEMGSGVDIGCDDAAPICVTSMGAPTCVECDSDDDCDVGTVCNPASMCVPGCDDDDDCAATPETPVCDVVARTCAECVTDTDCSGVARCSPVGTCEFDDNDEDGVPDDEDLDDDNDGILDEDELGGEDLSTQTATVSRPTSTGTRTTATTPT